MSFVTAPIVVERENTYVLFVTDAALGVAAASFEWTFTAQGEPPVTFSTARSVTSFWPTAVGPLKIELRVLDGGGLELTSLALIQEVVRPSSQAEAIIEQAEDAPGPGAGNPEVLRELVNEHGRYYQAVTPRAPEAGDGFVRLTFSFVWDGAQRLPPRHRAWHVDRLATALNEQPADFVGLAAEGVGVSDLRLGLLAMTLRASAGGPPLLPWTELPEAPSARAFADEQLRAAVGGLSETARIDLFNVARFPKSNITQCSHILEALRDRYFAGTSFQDVLTGMSGIRAHWITRHYREGPLTRSA